MFLSPQDLVHRLPLKKGDKACDFGCGSGAYLSSLSNMVGNIGKVFAFDIHQDMIERLQREAEKYGYDNVEFAACDIEKKTYLENYSIDAVILSNILFQLENPDAVIKEVKRVLKPNGFLLVVD
jgi:SAM-dependent methyltransferase